MKFAALLTEIERMRAHVKDLAAEVELEDLIAELDSLPADVQQELALFVNLIVSAMSPERRTALGKLMMAKGKLQAAHPQQARH